MKAMTYYSYGAPEVLALDDVPKPVPQENEVLVRNHASVVSAVDVQARAADPAITRLHFGLVKPKWPVLGATFSGVVDSVGGAVTRFKPGDAVSGVNVAGFGAHAEYILLPQDGVITATPTGLTHEQTVAVFDGSLTALPFLRDHAQLRRGQSILINGASGAVGTAAVQLAKYYGATVTAVCSAGNATLVRSLGADTVIDYHRTDFTTAKNTYDVIFNAVAKSSFRRSRGALKKTGIYLTTVPSPTILAEMFWTSRFGTRKAVIAFTGLAKPAAMTADLKFIAGLAGSGQYSPVIDTVDAFEDAAAAHRHVASGRKAGSAVLAIHPQAMRR